MPQATQSQPVEALWGMVTEAAVSLQGRRARLAKEGRTLAAEILAPEDARFDTVSTRPPEPQNPNEGTRKLVVRLPGKIERTEIVVMLK